MKRPVVLLIASALVACAAPRKAPLPPGAADTSPPPAAARNGTDTKLAQAVTAPLTDLNLVREAIPPVLQAAQKAPYGPPADGSCPTLAREVEALDAALGADLDATASGTDPTLAERGAEAATDAVIGAVRNTTEGVIPFRGWVRKLTGAERYAKEVAAAIAAGTIRRAYLKGLGTAAGCPPPAAPRQPAPAASAAVS